MKLPLSAFLASLISLVFSLQGSARPWTNRSGKTIEADYVSHTDAGVVLLINGKPVTYPIDNLSDADRAFLASMAAAPPAPAVQPKTGKLTGLKFTSRLFPDPDGYYKDSDRKAIRRAFEDGAFPDSNKGDPAEWLKPDPEKDGYRLYVPAAYDGSEPYGLLLHINSGDPGGIPDAWLPLCDELKLIAVSADHIGNNHPMLRRVQCSMDAIANTEKTYRIDPARRVVTGLSGGGHMAMLTAAMYPDYFRGAISHAAQSYLPIKGKGHFPGLAVSDFKSSARRHLRWIVISGDKDKNYQEILSSGKEWEDEKLTYRFLDVPGMAHTTAAIEPMREALVWVGMTK